MLSSASLTSRTAAGRPELPKSATKPLFHGQIADDRHLTGLNSKLLAPEPMTLVVAFRRAAQKHWRAKENSQSASERRTKKT